MGGHLDNLAFLWKIEIVKNQPLDLTMQMSKPSSSIGRRTVGIMSLSFNDFKPRLAILGVALVASLSSTPSVHAAVALENHQNGTPEAAPGNHGAVRLADPGIDPGLSLSAEINSELSLGSGSGLDQPPNGNLFAGQDLTGETKVIPKVLVTGAAMGFGGLAVTGMFMLRRKDTDFHQP
jgi:hypothetical protein